MTIPVRQRAKITKNKDRDIKYAAHLDAAIFSYYAKILQEYYEKWLSDNSLDKAVIGYRSGIGSNVDMAAEAFSETAARGTVTALCFDISNFFPTIPHSELKLNLQTVLGQEVLSSDWYKVFRACTKFSHIDFTNLSHLFGFNPNDAPRPLVQDIASAMKTIRASQFLVVNTDKIEIPQGTPISSVFANVAMMRFDLALGAWAVAHNAFYRRYSDDILLLVSPTDETLAVAEVTAAAAALGEDGLVINPEKTEVSRFLATATETTVDRPMTYLGFTFDGHTVTLRARTLSRYYRRMTYAARGTIKGAGRAGQPASKAFRRTIYRDLSHLGSTNFYQYAKRAHTKFHSSSVRRQLRRHFTILLRKLENRGR